MPYITEPMSFAFDVKDKTCAKNTVCSYNKPEQDVNHFYCSQCACHQKRQPVRSLNINGNSNGAQTYNVSIAC